jgi:hypothetical protein
MYTLFVCECHVRNSGQRAADALDTLLALTDAEQSVLAHCYYVQSMLARAHKECKGVDTQHILLSVFKIDEIYRICGSNRSV